MTDKNTANRSANMVKAEGDRDTRWPERRGEGDPSERYGNCGDQGGGITNRPLDEEIENQAALPERGRSQKEERIEHDRRERENREDIVGGDERGRDLTPRRYDEKRPTDATMPSNDATLRTEI